MSTPVREIGKPMTQAHGSMTRIPLEKFPLKKLPLEKFPLENTDTLFGRSNRIQLRLKLSDK